MIGNIELKQYDGSQILPKDDAILYDMIVGQNGIIKGCELTWMGSNQIHIDSGYGIIKGRLFEVAEQTIYAGLPDAANTHFGYVIIVADLENTDEPIKITTRICESAAMEDDWTQDEEMNLVNGMWEMPIAEYEATNTGISSFTDLMVKVESTFTTIQDFSELAAIAEKGYIVDATLSKKQILTFINKTVAVSAWVNDETYADYPYRAAISCTGVDTNYVPNVTFGVEECASALFAPVAMSAGNKIYIYANAVPDAAITIPTIQCIRKVG